MITAQWADEIDRFYIAYGAAFAARDLAALEAMCEYPMVLADAGGRRQVRDASFYLDLLERFGRSRWATTRLDRTEVLAMGGDAAVLVTEYVRLREDGSELDADELPFPKGCTYYLRRRESGWKIVGLSEPLPG